MNRIYLIVLIFAVMAFSGPVTTDNDVSEYAQQFDNGTCNKHVSGRVHSKDADEKVGIWRQGFISECQVVFTEPKDIIKDVQKLLGDNFVYSYDTSTNVASFVIPKAETQTVFANITEAMNSQHLKDLERSKHKQKDELVVLGKTMSKRIVKCFDNDIEYSHEDITRINGSIESIDVNFRRIFLGGIVLGNTSYVSVTLDGNGNVTSIQFKWPKFKHIKDENSRITMSHALTQINIILDRSISTGKLKSGNIKGTALGWNTLVTDNGLIISPCYSFHTVVDIDDEDPNQFINVPILTKYYK